MTGKGVLCLVDIDDVIFETGLYLDSFSKDWNERLLYLGDYSKISIVKNSLYGLGMLRKYLDVKFCSDICSEENFLEKEKFSRFLSIELKGVRKPEKKCSIDMSGSIIIDDRYYTLLKCNASIKIWFNNSNSCFKDENNRLTAKGVRGDIVEVSNWIGVVKALDLVWRMNSI